MIYPKLDVTDSLRRRMSFPRKVYELPPKVDELTRKVSELPPKVDEPLLKVDELPQVECD